MELIQEMVTVFAFFVGSSPALDNDMVYAFALLIAVLEFFRFLSLILILLSTIRSTVSFAFVKFLR